MVPISIVTKRITRLYGLHCHSLCLPCKSKINQFHLAYGIIKHLQNTTHILLLSTNITPWNLLLAIHSPIPCSRISTGMLKHVAYLTHKEAREGRHKELVIRNQSQMLTPSSKPALGFNSLGTQFCTWAWVLLPQYFPRAYTNSFSCLTCSTQHYFCVLLRLFGG